MLTTAITAQPLLEFAADDESSLNELQIVTRRPSANSCPVARLIR